MIMKNAFFFVKILYYLPGCIAGLDYSGQILILLLLSSFTTIF